MPSRLVANQSLLTVGSHATAPFRVSRATPQAVLTIKAELSVAGDGAGTMKLEVRQVANPGVTTGLVAVPFVDTDLYRTMVIDEPQATGTYETIVYFPTVGGVFDLLATVTGTATFKLTTYIAP